MFLSWLPIVGPIIEGLVSAYSKSKDSQVAIYTQDTIRKGKETDADVQIINARAQVAIEQDSIGNRLIRDVFMFPIAVHTFMSYWDAIFAKHSAFVFGVDPAPENIKYIPYAVIGYLFVTAYRGR